MLQGTEVGIKNYIHLFLLYLFIILLLEIAPAPPWRYTTFAFCLPLRYV